MSKKPYDVAFKMLNQLSLQQKVMIGGSAVLATILLIVLLTFLNEPSFSALYSDLDSEDASKVLEYLNSQKISYKIDDNGKTVLIPKDKIYETRVNLASKGIPTSGTIGYELFDKNTMGMSEFMQKLNFKRSLEGELSRTILGIQGIDGVRVHIVFPEKSIFKDEQKEPTASVVLKLKDNFALPKSSALAIVNLVASAVEGLKPSSITVIDTKGKMLWKDDEDGALAFSSGKQYEIKNSVENYLAQKAQNILDNVLGLGNSMVQINADLNFDQVEKTMETYDPDQQVVVSEQTLVSNNNGKSVSDTSSQNNQSSTTNYENGKTIEKVVQGTGNIKRLSVAAVINDIPKEVQKGDIKETVYQPRSPEQLKKLEELIKNAVGIDPTRNDQISIVNLPFQTTPESEITHENTQWFKNVDGIPNLIIVVVAIIGAIFLLRSLMTKLKNEQIFIGNVNEDLNLLPATGSGSTLISKTPNVLNEMKRKKELIPIGDIEDDISDEAVNKKNRQEKITNYVAKNPTEAAKLLNAWLHEDE